MLEHCDAYAAVNGLIAVHHQEPIDHRFRVVTYDLAAGERHFVCACLLLETCESERFPGIMGTFCRLSGGLRLLLPLGHKIFETGYTRDISLSYDHETYNTSWKNY